MELTADVVECMVIGENQFIPKLLAKLANCLEVHVNKFSISLSRYYIQVYDVLDQIDLV